MYIYLQVIPKYWGKQIFSLGSFPEMGQKQKTYRERKAKVGNNNGQLRIANATSGVACKPPGSKFINSLSKNFPTSSFCCLYVSNLTKVYIDIS